MGVVALVLLALASSWLWAASAQFGIMVVYQPSNVDQVGPVARLIDRLKQLRAQAGLDQALVLAAPDFGQAATRQRCEKLGIKASDLPLVVVVRLGPEGDPVEALNWHRQADSASVADVAFRQAERLMGIQVASLTPAPRPSLTSTPSVPPTPTPTPVPTPVPAPSPDAQSFVRQAQQAFDDGRYVEPPGNNVVELARKALEMDPSNQPARDLMARAASAYENQARLAIARNDTAQALEMYRRLFSLFPDRGDYMTQIEALQKPAPAPVPVPDILGVWSGTETAGSHQDWTIRADGTASVRWHALLERGRLTGTWKCTDARQRTFQFEWKGGNSDELTLSTDGSSLDGRHVVVNDGIFNGSRTIHLLRATR